MGKNWFLAEIKSDKFQEKEEGINFKPNWVLGNQISFLLLS